MLHEIGGSGPSLTVNMSLGNTLSSSDLDLVMAPTTSRKRLSSRAAALPFASYDISEQFHLIIISSNRIKYYKLEPLDHEASSNGTQSYQVINFRLHFVPKKDFAHFSF